MKLFFLLFTPAEAGAPGYLSRQGEESAASLAESVFGFLTGSLGVDLDSGFAERARSLEEDVRWRLFRKPEQIGEAAMASLALEPNVLLVSGGHERTQNTAQALARRLGLPVCVDARADGHTVLGKKNTGTLADTLASITSGEWTKEETPPRAIVVGTTREALEEWTGLLFSPDKHTQLKAILERTTKGGVFPSVFACGFESAEPTSTAGKAEGTWIFD